MQAIDSKQPQSQVTPEMMAQLPEGLAAQLASPAFAESCMAAFDHLDKNGDQKLSRDELLPVIPDILGEIDGPPLNPEQCMSFVGMVRARAHTHTHTHAHTHTRARARARV